MEKKITWCEVYKQFRRTYPSLRKHAIHWFPHDYLQIEIWFDDGNKMIYDYGAKNGSWIAD